MSVAEKPEKSVTAAKIFPIGLVCIVMMLIVPLHPVLMDILLAVSITAALIVFLLSINFENPVEFSTFPTVLLITTLLRLSLNIASTRLILLHGHEGTDAAGSVIQTFGQFVVGGNYLVGVIIFLILVIINFKVLTSGAGRIAEVAARFTLDAMPGKQMAIDNELANGHITDIEARARREAISEEADFYGAMDGANKFVKGDAVAGLIITAINLVGGMLIGMVQMDLSFASAAESYTILTIGDGLVSQIPALLLSTAAGLIATRTASGSDLGSTLANQLLNRRDPLNLASITLAAMALLPGMPTFSFLLLAGGTFAIGRRAARIARERAAEDQTPKEGEAGTAGASTDAEPPIHDIMAVDLLALEVGFDLVPLVDKSRGGELIARIGQIRRQLAQELGVVVPPVRVRDNLQLSGGDYQIILSGTKVGGGQLQVHKFLAIDPGQGSPANLPGDRTTDPAFGLPATWIRSGDRERAELLGFTVVDPATVAATHITELLKSRAADFLGRSEAQELIDAFAQRNPKLVEEVIPTLLPLGDVIKVLKRLLAEGVSIRDLRTILESLADHAATTKDSDQLTELVRQSMALTLTSRFAAGDGSVHALVLDPRVEQLMRGTKNGNESSGPDPAMLPKLIRGLEAALVSVAGAEHEPLLLTAPDVRRSVAALVGRHAPGLAVLSFNEIDPRSTVKTAGVVKLAA